MVLDKYKELLRLAHIADNAVLKNKSEYLEAAGVLERLGFPLHGDLPKNWDSLAALTLLCRKFENSETCDLEDFRVLDAGGEYYSVILPHLAQLGFEQLYCLNLSFNEPIQYGPIRYLPGDITQTTFADSFFDAVVCLSVIEHGIPLQSFFMEMRRIIKSGGLLVVSADYWDTPLDTGGKMAYGVPLRIFDKPDLLAIGQMAEENGFQLTAIPDLETRDKTVSWMGMSFTFIYLSFNKLS